MTLFNQLREQRHLAKEAALAILAVAAAERTPEQVARLDVLEAEIAGLDKDIDRAAKFIQTDLLTSAPTGTVQVGIDHASERPWGPTVPATATAAMILEARQAAMGEFAIAVRNAASGRSFDPRLTAGPSGMRSDVPSDGGFAVPIELASGIERTMFETGALLSLVDARTISGDAIAYNVIDETSRASTRSGGVLGYWVAQGNAPTA
ncbi:MAG: hypothetical protein RLZZ524_2927, partial [Pseudomonadota bacterium]